MSLTGIILHSARDYESDEPEGGFTWRYDKLHHKYRGAINALAQANEDLDAIMGREEVWLKEKKALEEQIEQLKESKARLKEKKGELKANLREKREKKKVRVANAKAKQARRKTKGSATKA